MMQNAPRILSSTIIIGLLTWSLATSLPAAESWTQWRGPTGQGVASTSGLPVKWSEKENVAWRTELPGKGWSSPVIEGNEIWMTTAVEFAASPEEAKKRLAKNTGNQPLNVADHVVMRALCVDRTTGKLLHNVELFTVKEPEPVHKDNSYASPTPILENGRLYCAFGSFGTCCLDTKTLQLAWKQDQLTIKHENGPGSTPVLWKDFLIVHCDGSDVQYIAALNKKDGAIVWKTSRTGEMNSDPQLRKAYGTPLVMEVGGRPVVVSPAADWLYFYEPATGKEITKLKYGVLGFSIVPRPVAGNGLVYMSTSFMQAQILAVDVSGLTASGPKIKWSFAKQAPRMPSPLVVGNELYLVSDGGVATCLDAKTGEVNWTERFGGNFASSPLAADGRVYFMSREGVTTVVAPGKKFEKLAQNQLEGSILASPAALDGALYVRTDKAMYRIQKSGVAE